MSADNAGPAAKNRRGASTKRDRITRVTVWPWLAYRISRLMDPVRINSREREGRHREWRLAAIGRERRRRSIGSSLSHTLRGRKVQRVVNNRLHGVECQLRFNHRGSIGRETGRDITGRRETPPRFDGQG